jgi:large-conductance mechanosensitive channel
MMISQKEVEEVKEEKKRIQLIGSIQVYTNLVLINLVVFIRNKMKRKNKKERKKRKKRTRNNEAWSLSAMRMMMMHVDEKAIFV